MHLNWIPTISKMFFHNVLFLISTKNFLETLNNLIIKINNCYYYFLRYLLCLKLSIFLFMVLEDLLLN